MQPTQTETFMTTYTAPAKVILLGEHAVVYGQPAIAIPFPALTATAEPTPAPIGSGLTLIAPDAGVQLQVKLDGKTPDNVMAYPAQIALQHLGIQPPDLTITVHTTIPLGGGFGSGAAISAVVMRALFGALGASVDEDQLNALVYETEKIHHGTPSGIDNTVIVKNRPIYFVRNQPIEAFKIGKPLPLVVAFTGVSASTKESVGDVRKLVESSNPKYMRHIEWIGHLAKTGRKHIENGDLLNLGRTMTINQVLLDELTVSSPLLNKLIQAAMNAGALGAKLSGGGRGGNMIALTDANAVERVSKALRDAGAVQTWTVLLE